MGSHYDGTKEESRALSAYINLMRAGESLIARLARVVSVDDLTASQFGVLEALYHLGPMTQTVLSEKLLKTSGNMTMVVDNLQKVGLVSRRRRKEDRRCVTVTLTAKGTRLIKKVLPRRVDGIVEEMSRLTVREQEELRRLCRKLGKQED